MLIGQDLLVNMLDIAFLACLLFIAQLYSGAPVKKMSFLPGCGWLLDRSTLWPIVFFFVLFAAKNLAGFFVYKAQSRFRYEVALRISCQNLLRYFEGSYSDYVDVDSSTHFSRVNLQPSEFCEHVMEGLQEIFKEWTLILLTVAAILLFNAGLFLLLLVLLFPPVVITAWMTRRQILAAKANIAARRRSTWQRLEESIAAFVEANLYGRKPFFVSRYFRSQQEQNKHLAALRTVQGVPTRLAEVFAVFGFLILIAIELAAGHGRGTGFVTLGAFLAAAYKIIPGVAGILNLHGQMQAYAYTIDDLAAAPGGTRRATGGPEPAVKKEPAAAVKRITSITLQDVSFRYHGRYVLEHLHLHIETGCFLGIAGDSGRGKTTLLHVLLGFLEPGKGQVLYNGENQEREERRRYWRDIAYVKQQPLILQDTLRVNITLDEDGVDEERLAEVIAISGVDAVAARLPGGLDGRIAENGRNISGGQRQRIAIARALYKNAGVYILDEPFSELDEASEERLLGHFRMLADEGRIVILITHNTKSLGRCSQHLRLDEREGETASARNRIFFL